MAVCLLVCQSMLKIRLQRTGRTNVPTFRIVLTDSKNSTKSGRYLEVLGSYDAVNNVKEVKADRVKHWLSMGAQLTGTLHNFFIEKKIIEGKKINVLPKKKPIKKEETTPVAGTPVAAVAATPAPAEAAPEAPKPVEAPVA